MDAEAPSFKRELLSTLPSLRAFAVSLSGRHDKADDLVQDTVMKAWAKQSSFEMGTNIKAWLFTILRNEFYSQMRKRGREVQDSDGAMTARLAVHPSQHGSMDLEDFRNALERLPEDQREAITVPAGAVLADGSGERVQVIRDGRVEARPVKAGILWDGQREILDGLQPGEVVMQRAGAFFRDGDPVKPVTNPEPEPALPGPAAALVASPASGG